MYHRDDNGITFIPNGWRCIHHFIYRNMLYFIALMKQGYVQGLLLFHNTFVYDYLTGLYHFFIYSKLFLYHRYHYRRSALYIFISFASLISIFHSGRSGANFMPVFKIVLLQLAVMFV